MPIQLPWDIPRCSMVLSHTNYAYVVVIPTRCITCRFAVLVYPYHTVGQQREMPRICIAVLWQLWVQLQLELHFNLHVHVHAVYRSACVSCAASSGNTPYSMYACIKYGINEPLKRTPLYSQTSHIRAVWDPVPDCPDLRNFIILCLLCFNFFMTKLPVSQSLHII